ncbi:MAG: hypothetical protein HFI11_03590 [Lachnospiraceae bacterium]|jgi:predicted transcriptional regulator|nr:hypothetical protein [Lachnospiraceae bacterium]
MEAVLTESKKKMGRPTDNPRPYSLTIRISEADKRILEKYCARTGVNRTEAISRGIGMLKAEDAATPDEAEVIREARQEIERGELFSHEEVWA